MKLTGERPVPGLTPDSLLALHAAGYREVRARLGRGRVLDAGCGLGFETAQLVGEGRTVVGIDYDATTAATARRSFGASGARFACSDAARLALRSGAFDWACSSHIVEHFDTPARHVAELARVLAPTGTAFFLTPNGPWDFENPFHLVLFTRSGLENLLRGYFSEVWVGALEGSETVKEDFAARRAKADRLLAIADPLDLRHRLPRKWWVAAYTRALPLGYRVFARGESNGGSGITHDDYFVTEQVEDTTPVLFAVASRPLQPTAAICGGGGR